MVQHEPKKYQLLILDGIPEVTGGIKNLNKDLIAH